MLKGVDLSKNNWVNDYNQVKDAIDCAILKIIQKDGNLEDSFLTHLEGCRSVNLPVVGVYNYSYATTKEKAAYDAALVVGYLKAVNLSCSVWLDLEDKVTCGLGHTLIDIIKEYKKVISLNNYPFGIYCSSAYYNQYIKPYFNEVSDIPIWIARYYAGDKIFTPGMDPDQNKLPNIVNTCIWQYTSKGTVPGIKGAVDMDLFYYDAVSALASVVPAEDPEPVPVEEDPEPSINIPLLKSSLISVREGINTIISMLEA